VCWSTLRHELVHAAGRRGHGKEFKTLAVELGLTGPMTATVASPELLDFINWTLLPKLGKYPHGAITGRGQIVVPPTEPGDKPIVLRPDDRPKKQSARMLKAECPECGYTIRLAKKWARTSCSMSTARVPAFTSCRRPQFEPDRCAAAGLTRVAGSRGPATPAWRRDRTFKRIA
jgi:hypothetical protein